MNQYPIIQSKAALAFWSAVLVFSLFAMGWLTFRHGQPIPQSLMLATIALWMLTGHQWLYHRLRRWRLQFVPEVFRWLLFILIGYIIAGWFL